MRKTSALLAVATAAASTAAIIALPAAASAAAPPSAATTGPATAATTAATVPTFDYRDCPQLPPGVDPTKWRCEVLVAEGTATIGGATLPFDFTAVTHAEGPLPDGTPGQVFGGFRAASLPVPGRQSGDGHGPKLWMRPQLTAVPDFYSQSGAMSLTFQLTGPRLAPQCSIGTNAAPVQIAAGRVPGTTQWISQNPPIITFQVLDQTLAVPEVSGCGREAEELNRRFGLPSPSGANRLSGTAFYSFKNYAQL
ncbi:hypothetical protein [Catenulispora pinisilvae]|uniref:hypothetical protein n=1 Tax=Catenulispora pinisilvae TaxID=2705253 RepID=UPI00189241B1|nr:hypothetical protein [Catenulispora pinisilvae]